MKHKILIFMLVLLAAATAASAQRMAAVNPNDKILMDNEKMMWQYLTDKKYDEYAAMLTDDFEQVNQRGVISKSAFMTEARTYNFFQCFPTGMKVKWINKDAAIVTSKLTVRATYSDKSTRDVTDWSRTIWIKSAFDGKEQWKATHVCCYDLATLKK